MAATRLGWLWGFLLLAAAPGAVASERPVVIVHVDDRANVPASDLAGARREVGVIFGEAGVAIEWTTGRFPASIIGPAAARDGRRHVALLLVNADEVPGEPSSGCTLGFAARKPAVAYAFYNRIAELGQIRPIDLRVVLGRVIAHELGHVLLPPNAHSPHGIMRSNLDLEPVNPDRFTAAQARALRSVLDYVAIRE
jgi:hypothetical protein